jgi:glycosyltransferase involved in cell wall biosynthesis
MEISLIICTRNRCGQLARCLESIRKIHFDRRWELIIIDNGSTDETASVVYGFARTTSISLRYAVEFKRGTGHAKNAGLGIAQGDIAAFTDDDCYPEPDFLSKIWSVFTDPAIGFIGGRVVLHDSDDYPISVNESTIAQTFPCNSFIHAGVVIGANMAFRLDILKNIGGFDPLFGAGSPFPAAEDADVVARVSAAGWKGLYAPEVTVRHHHGRKAADIPSLMKAYDIGRGAYHMKLLMKGGHLWWFLRGVYGIHWRARHWNRAAPVWEAVGGAKYIYVHVTRALRGWWPSRGAEV